MIVFQGRAYSLLITFILQLLNVIFRFFEMHQLMGGNAPAINLLLECLKYLLISKGCLQVSDVECMVVLYSKEDPHSLPRKFNIGQDHQKIYYIKSDVCSCIIRYCQNPSYIKDNIDDRYYKIGCSWKQFVFSKNAVLFVKTDETPICAQICLYACKC